MDNHTNNNNNNDNDSNSLTAVVIQQSLEKWERSTPCHGFALSESLTELIQREVQQQQQQHKEIVTNNGKELDPSILVTIMELTNYLKEGKYINVLRYQSDIHRQLFRTITTTNGSSSSSNDNDNNCTTTATMTDRSASSTVRSVVTQRIHDMMMIQEDYNSSRSSEEGTICSNNNLYSKCIVLECIGIAAFQLFLQCNYTGPTLSDDPTTLHKLLHNINPHSCFDTILNKHSTEQQQGTSSSLSEQRYQNAVLSELAMDGEWPCQVCQCPYFFLLARIIFDTLSLQTTITTTSTFPNTADSGEQQQQQQQQILPVRLHGVHWWNSRVCVAHHRLISSMKRLRYSTTLWTQITTSFEKCKQIYTNDNNNAIEAATVQLEWGLAQYYLSRCLPTADGSKQAFQAALEHTGLSLQVTGAMGKRTKFQQDATAQMMVHAKSKMMVVVPNHQQQQQQMTPEESTTMSNEESELIKKQMIEHAEDGILLERIKFEDESKNEIHDLTIIDQSILLAFCLDVKNNNPADGLTSEEMGAYLARVLDHHDDWMVYSTALLERAWLEFDRNHARERAILQLQALVDQHTNRLTITQSTRESIESSAPVQDRLIHLHSIVYPPRWAMFQDLASRYESLGIVSSAAELYLEIEEWDSVVDCYRRAGRVAHAEKIVRERLAINETPRMWAALGDLTKDPAYYEKAIELSKGRFADAYLALGEYYFDRGELEAASVNYERALQVRPLNGAAWFRLGAISMRLSRWKVALHAFSEVVLQRPDEAEAWANIAAIHLHNKSPTEAYPALNESLRHQRLNWRVWISKLYTCLDLEKYDEAVLACNTLLDLRSQRQASDKIPPLEEKCVRALVGGSLKRYHEASDMKDEAAMDSSRRTLSRVHTLLDRLNASADYSSWILETTTYFHEHTGQESAKVLDDLTKEYRALQSNVMWEKDDVLVRKLCQVVSHMAHIYTKDEKRESLVQLRFTLRSVIQKVRTARPDDPTIPIEIQQLQQLLLDVNEKLSNQ